jgi:hypothetical protein
MNKQRQVASGKLQVKAEWLFLAACSLKLAAMRRYQ